MRKLQAATAAGDRTIDPELDRIVSLEEAARLRGVSVDALRRHAAKQILQLSPRRQGMRVRDALMLGEAE